MSVVHLRRPSGGTLAALVAERYGQRLLGLAGLPALPPDTGLLIPRCRSVHTFGMRFSIDVLFVTVEGGSLRVHDVRLGVPPFRVVRRAPRARTQSGLAVLELASGLGLRDATATRRLAQCEPE
jgi:uncharacterized membrane protein (UPF0127 family)